MTILNETIAPGTTKTVNMQIGTLHTMTELNIPVIVSRSTEDGPCVLLSAGLHGDEINGTEIVRQIIRKKLHIPKKGTIICMPVINIFGFVNQNREFPDGRDLNRVFPGSKEGSLASRFAYYILKEILPHVAYAIDFHAGGARRFNAPQIRIVPDNIELKKLSDVFGAPFTLFSSNISGSFRSSCDELGIKMLLFEGGKSLDINNWVATEAIEGTKRFLKHLEMLSEDKETVPAHETIYIEKSDWIRAPYSGMFQGIASIGKWVEKDEVIATISDPFGEVEHPVVAPHQGYLINVNDAPVVFEGDAVFHISSQLA
jgi:uncharacterized protein